ncbi:integrase [Actimicrobium sp. GrIS 1.19]|uniref:hypothetical protein n=1 Tax=Actimicrobium sp. GrIS 1.19 TaxID=3071708 RepID=UPI002DFF15D1|nr:integrase [Actimicrobium sp. GrIS 1.19]
MNEKSELIERARAIFTGRLKRKLKPSTIEDYEKKVASLRKKLGTTYNVDALIAEAMNTSKTLTWQANKSAIILKICNSLESFVAKYDAMNHEQIDVEQKISLIESEILKKLISRITTSLTLIEKILKATFPLNGRQNRHSKRADLQPLPDGWQERIAKRMPSYYLAALVTAVTGCRPCELIRGVTLTINENDGKLIALIYGAKITNASGQEWRRLYFSIDSESSLIQAIIKIVRAGATGNDLVVLVDSAKKFSGAMRAAGEREWPKLKSTVTPYSMRHQFAAYMKAIGALTSCEISAALGHCTDVTKSRYGHASMGKSAWALSPKSVEAAREVRIKNPSNAAKIKNILGKETAEFHGPAENGPEIGVDENMASRAA